MGDSENQIASIFHMDYDLTDIPAGYDRGREHGPGFLNLWMATLERHLHGLDVRRILDLGCGTGRFSEALATYFRAEVIGIDPSVKMLERAREKQHPDGVRYHLGSAEAISLPPRSVDVIFISMSFHHFVDRLSAACECRRVLGDSGVLCVRTGTREQIQSYPYVPFFPSTFRKLAEVLPDHAELCEAFEAAGFRLSASEVIMQTIAPNWSAYADKLSAGGDSILATLSAQEFEAGLTTLRRHVSEAPNQTVVEPIDLFVFRKG
jgi:ubiquinone/menaquinone biosynthesis C-methylase UbiE